ncbi:unnamed protein product [Lampetra planeri]
MKLSLCYYDLCLSQQPHLTACQVNFSQAVVGSSMSFNLTKAPPGCLLLSLYLQNHGKSGQACTEPVRILTWNYYSGFRLEPGRLGRVVVKYMESHVDSVELMVPMSQNAGEFSITLYWEYQGRVLNATLYEKVMVIEQAVSKPGISPRDPVVQEGGSLSLCCVLDRGSPPITYSWLRGNDAADVGGRLTETGVHTKMWTLHDARQGDMVAREVSNTMGEGETKTERSDIVIVTVTAPGIRFGIETLGLEVVHGLVDTAAPPSTGRFSVRCSPPPPSKSNAANEDIATPPGNHHHHDNDDNDDNDDHDGNYDK